MANSNYYNKLTWLLVFDLIKDANPAIDFTSDQVRLVSIEENIGGTEGLNTRGVLVGIPEMGREGEFTLEWNRRDIGEIFSKTKVYIAPKNQRMKSDLLPDINTQYPFELRSGDIYDSVINMALVPMTVTLTVRENNPAFMGSLEVTVGNPKVQLESVMFNSVLSGLNYPTNQAVKAQGPFLLYGKDFTYAKVELAEDYTFGKEIKDALLVSFNKKVPDVWVNTQLENDFNLNGSKITFNGLTRNSPVYVNETLYTHCVIIALNEEKCLNVAGHLILHYNG